ncbi:phospholipase A2 inhibitor and Ly6/PLAUR domain-containing protein-like [Spea bombifrons]|uniref:phospholipase A2 inhibitor and Ly6/PLAUR domain-containing protein-like n=1 Tax=Spea bombifrons TaxID=233779 RepID=UPI00234AADF0|nr:phospholipase A2 inhibitor and Ly6/PLAUR domain-containing protein-like [Spea bombifrons]
MSCCVAFLWLLAALLGEAFSLECIHCTSTTGNSCTGAKKACPTGEDHCISIYTESSLQSGKLKQFVRSCAVDKHCNQTSRMTFNYTSHYRSSKCCNRSECTPDAINLYEKREKNSVTCPYCDEKSEECKKTMPIQCLGEENKCITYSYVKMEANNNNVTHTMRGCATEDMCEAKKEALLLGEKLIPKSVVCSRGSIISNLLFPGVSGLLFLKLLS